jgi:hypothetical protein
MVPLEYILWLQERTPQIFMRLDVARYNGNLSTVLCCLMSDEGWLFGAVARRTDSAADDSSDDDGEEYIGFAELIRSCIMDEGWCW